MNGPPAPLVSLRIATEQDVVIARRRARDVAALAGFDRPDQIRVATAVSDVARLALRHAGADARVEVDLGDWRGAPALLVAVSGLPGPARALERLLAGAPETAPGEVPPVLRLVDGAEVAGGEDGAGVVLAKVLPAAAVGHRDLSRERLAAELAKTAHPGLYEELRMQGQELLQALQELRAREEDLVRLNAELRAASESKTRFLRSVGHELRTPVNAIGALGRMLLEPAGGPLDGERRHQASLIVGAADGLAVLVNDLLDLAKAEAGRLDVRPGDFGIEEVFASLDGLLRPLVPSDAVALVFEEPRDVPRLRSDEMRLTQILRNLVTNALKFTRRGEVRVRAAFDPGAGRLVVSVSDTGIGIAPEDRERIFEEFTQLPGPMQHRSRGTGLGLALSRHLAHLLGGRLDLESELGRGSTFSVAIPVLLPESPPAGAAPAPEAAARAGAVSVSERRSGGATDVLVVDDDETYRYLLRGLLRGLAGVVVEAAGGVEGLRLARERRPALVLLDLSMGDMDGRDVLRALREGPDTRAIPVVVVTSVDLDGADRAELAASSAEVLPKRTLTRETLAGAVRRALAPSPARAAEARP